MEGHLRLSYAGTVKDVTEGIARIKWALDPTSPNEIYIGDKQARSGTGYEQPARHQDARAGRRPRRSRATTASTTTASSNLRTASTGTSRPRRSTRRSSSAAKARIARGGPVVVNTGKHTARSANDKFVVREPSTEEHVWWGQYNRPFAPDKFNELFDRLQGFLQGRDLFVQDCYAGADPDYRMPVRIITEHAWHSLFARNMFILPKTQRGVPAPRAGVHRHLLPRLQGHPADRRHGVEHVHRR